MNWPRFYNLIFSFCLGAGVLFAQVCNVVCIAANCASEKKVVTTETPETASHCQHSESPKSSEPNPDDDSHSCQTHDLVVLLAASESPANAVAQVDWQPIALLPAWIEVQFLPQTIEQARLSALRSPPRLPQRQILRI
jgi:hypothetical protein